MRPLSKKTIKAKNKTIPIQKSLFKAKKFSSSSSASSVTNQDSKSVHRIFDKLKSHLAKDGGSWKVEPRDSVEVYKERRRRQKKSNGRIAKKGKTNENRSRRRQKPKKKPIKSKKQSCSCEERRLNRKMTRFSSASSETSSDLFSSEN